MKRAKYALVIAIAFAMGSGSAVAEEQTVPSKIALQPTVMSDAQLDQIVGGSHIDTIVAALSAADVWDKGPDEGAVVSGKLGFALSHIPGHE